MALFSGQSSIINRFLGRIDVEDETNLPVGLSAECRNVCFDSMTSVRTRDGINTSMTGVNKSPITGLLGLLYTPETSSETFFQLPTIFDYMGSLQYEDPVGAGAMHPYPAGMFTPPANAHMIATQTYNKGWAAFSNLTSPISSLAVIDPKTKAVWPFGMKPYGWTWIANSYCYVGEMATPTTPGGNGHTYRCTQAGTTGAAEPVWPLNEEGTVNDGTVVWEEWTAVVANRLPAPPSPNLGQSAGGTWATNLDVYIVITLVNSMGESLPSTPVKFTTNIVNANVTVAVPTLILGLSNSLPGWMNELGPSYIPTGINVYAASVAHGAAAPALVSYAKSNVAPISIAIGSPSYSCTGAGAGSVPPTFCTARVTPGQLPTPDTEPDIVRAPGLGTFLAGRDVYVAQTYVNGAGETTLGPASSVLDTVSLDGIRVNVAQPEDDTGKALFSITSIGIYECDVANGATAPDSTQFRLFNYYSPGSTVTITTSAAGANPPSSNTTGPGGNITADTSTGGINGTQGYRYAALMFMNQNYTVSGFTVSSVIKTVIDQDGWELGVFKVPVGPAYTLAVPVAFTVADGSIDGPFWWIGNVNLQVPSAAFVYPQTFTSDGVAMSATVLQGNGTASAILNFTDDYLQTSNNVTDRLRVIWPPQAAHVSYLPSIDRLALTGVPGYYSGCWLSLAADPESFYSDLSFVSVGSDDGERAWGTIEYRGTPYLLRERSGLALAANPNSPQSWIATKRWSEVGPCGPRAFDACGMFMVFVHRSGIYKYEDTSPDLMTKEIPYFWKSINWLYANTICCRIDHEKHEIHLLVPVGNSQVPNQEIVLNYLEGWQNPIHFSTYSGREISMDACRKFSVNDVAAWVCDRVERTVTGKPVFLNGDAEIPLTDSTYFVSQFLYGSSAADGTVQAVTPGVFADNGSGIDCVYETVCPQTTMALSKIEGFTLNARGNGTLYPYFIGGRDMVTGQNEDGSPMKSLLLACRTVDLSVMQSEGISRMVPSRLNERWRMRFTNGKVAGSYFSLKWLAMYTIQFANARDESESGG